MEQKRLSSVIPEHLGGDVVETLVAVQKGMCEECEGIAREAVFVSLWVEHLEEEHRSRWNSASFAGRVREPT
jgi:hypothetical protein